MCLTWGNTVQVEIYRTSFNNAIVYLTWGNTVQIKIYLKTCLSSSCCISQEVGEYIEFLDEVTENKELKDLVGKLIKYIECIKGLKGTYEILKAGNFD